MSDKQNHLIRLSLIAVLTFIAYSNSFNSEFHFDDYSSIIAHPYIKSIDNIPYFFYYKGAPLTERPVTMTTFAVNYSIGGLNPLSYHLVNFFIHLANAMLVYFLMVFTFKTPYLGESQFGEPMNHKAHSPIHLFTHLPLFIALMFALHPIQTQAVTYIVQRAEILSAFFYLLALVLFIKARTSSAAVQQCSGIAEQQREKTRRTTVILLYYISFISAIFAMGSKEIAVTLPLIILLYDFFFLSEGHIRNLLRKWAVHMLFFLTLLPLIYFVGFSQLSSFLSTEAVQSPPTSSVYAQVPSITRSEYLLTQFRVVWTYIRLLILPINQNVDYDYPVSRGIIEPITTLFGGLGIAALLALMLLLFRRQRILFFFILWFFIILAPTSSIVVLPDVIFEHRVYLSSLGYFVIFAMGIIKASQSVLVFYDSIRSFLHARLSDGKSQR